MKKFESLGAVLSKQEQKAIVGGTNYANIICTCQLGQQSPFCGSTCNIVYSQCYSFCASYGGVENYGRCTLSGGCW